MLKKLAMKLKRKKKGKDKVEKDKSELNLVVPVDSPHIERKTESVYTMSIFCYNCWSIFF